MPGIGSGEVSCVDAALKEHATAVFVAPSTERAVREARGVLFKEVPSVDMLPTAG